MKILIINGFLGNQRGLISYRDFKRATMDIFEEETKEDPLPTEYVERTIAELEDFIYEPDSPDARLNERANADRFDGIDVIAIDGDMRIPPWDPQCQSLIKLLRVCLLTDKLTLCCGLGALAMAFVCTTKGLNLSVLNSPLGAPLDHLAASWPFPLSSFTIPQSHEVLVESTTGDLYGFHERTRTWVPVANVGLHLNAQGRTKPPLGAPAVQSDTIPKYSRQDHLLSHSQELSVLGIGDIPCRVKSSCLSHFLFKNIEGQEFVVYSPTRWVIDEHASSTAPFPFSSLASSSLSGEMVILRSKVLGLAFNVMSYTHPEAKLILQNHVHHWIQAFIRHRSLLVKDEAGQRPSPLRERSEKKKASRSPSFNRSTSSLGYTTSTANLLEQLKYEKKRSSMMSNAKQTSLRDMAKSRKDRIPYFDVNPCSLPYGTNSVPIAYQEPAPSPQHPPASSSSKLFDMYPMPSREKTAEEKMDVMVSREERKRRKKLERTVSDHLGPSLSRTFLHSSNNKHHGEGYESDSSDDLSSYQEPFLLKKTSHITLEPPPREISHEPGGKQTAKLRFERLMKESQLTNGKRGRKSKRRSREGRKNSRRGRRTKDGARKGHHQQLVESRLEERLDEEMERYFRAKEEGKSMEEDEDNDSRSESRPKSTMSIVENEEEEEGDRRTPILFFQEGVSFGSTASLLREEEEEMKSYFTSMFPPAFSSDGHEGGGGEESKVQALLQQTQRKPTKYSLSTRRQLEVVKVKPKHAKEKPYSSYKTVYEPLIRKEEEEKKKVGREAKVTSPTMEVYKTPFEKFMEEEKEGRKKWVSPSRFQSVFGRASRMPLRKSSVLNADAGPWQPPTDVIGHVHYDQKQDVGGGWK